MPRIQLVNGLTAILVIARFRDGEVLVLTNPNEGWRLILNVARPLLPRAERARVLLAC
jgi:hypothetical protein